MALDVSDAGVLCNFKRNLVIEADVSLYFGIGIDHQIRRFISSVKSSSPAAASSFEHHIALYHAAIAN